MQTMTYLYLAPLNFPGDVVTYLRKEGIVINVAPSFDGCDDFLAVYLVETGEVIQTMDSGVDKVSEPSPEAAKLAAFYKTTWKDHLKDLRR